MSSKIKILIGSVALLGICQAGLLVFITTNKLTPPVVSVAPNTTADEDAHLPRHQAYSMSREFFDDAYQNATPFSIDPKTVAAIIPHHLLVKDRIASFFAGLPTRRYQTVILISPNHFGQGSASIQLSRAIWETPYGDLQPNTKIIDKLTAQSGATIEEQTFDAEHGITGIVSFIKKSLPDATIVPVAIKSGASKEQLSTFIQALIQATDYRKTLVLASVDFSHYQTAKVGDLHDQRTLGIIQNFDFDRLPSVEVDSPESLAVTLRYAQAHDSQNSTILSSTNSSRLISQLDEPGTTHQIITFSPGKLEPTPTWSMLFFGDVMLDRNVRTKIDADGVNALLDPLAGEERRFFRGYDVISANLEGDVTPNGEHRPPVAENDFAFRPDNVATLVNDYHFNYFNIANNHITDQGFDAFSDTQNALANLGVGFAGCWDGHVANDCTTTSTTVAGQLIGWAGFSYVYHEIDIAAAQQEIKKLKVTHDLMIAQMHGGVEYTHTHSQMQERVAHALVDAGADLVIGAHPHVIQDIEVYNNVPIFYSLGNFIFDQYFSPDTQQGLAVNVIWTKHEQGSTLDITLLPTQAEQSRVRQMTSDAATTLFKKIVDWSDLAEPWRSQIMNGKLHLVQPL